MFPRDFQQRCNILLTQRIQPFEKKIRDAVTDLYCPESLRLIIKLPDPDRDCLVRPYLGRRRRLEKQSRFHAFSLRNYALHADQIEELGLDNEAYAKVMANTLAILYWKAHSDANDIEFVLAPPSSSQSVSEAVLIQSHVLGTHVVWILDLDCCRHISMNEKGIQQAVNAFYKNDPYYPRPRSANEEDWVLWKIFKDQFLATSAGILHPGSPEASLPLLWVSLVEQRRRPE